MTKCSDVVERLTREDSTLKNIFLTNKNHTEDELNQVIDCLLTHPNIINHVWLNSNELLDHTGIKLARFLSISTRILWLNMSTNWFSESTYLGVAEALRFNSSVKFLFLCFNGNVDRTRIEAAFVNALIINPNHPIDSDWRLFDTGENDYPRLKAEAEQRGHPTMQSMLSTHLLRSELTT